jgi:hypothetical protein
MWRYRQLTARSVALVTARIARQGAVGTPGEGRVSPPSQVRIGGGSRASPPQIRALEAASQDCVAAYIYVQ